MIKNTEIYNWPNFVSFIRILMVPVLFYLAIKQQPYFFISVIVFSEFTDVLDGFLARHLNQVTELGSHLDSWGDFLIYTSMAICAWILWPEIIQKEWLFFVLIVLSFTLPVLIGLIKFRTVTSYHTWSVKIAVAITIIGYILLFLELLNWPFYLATAVCVYAAIEEILITLIMKHQHVDVRTVWAAVRYSKE